MGSNRKSRKEGGGRGERKGEKQSRGVREDKIRKKLNCSGVRDQNGKKTRAQE